jgi:hypothetical protein
MTECLHSIQCHDKYRRLRSVCECHCLIQVGAHNKNIFILFSLALQPSAGFGLLVSRGFLITHNDAPQSVGLLWTNDQLVAETST